MPVRVKICGLTREADAVAAAASGAWALGAIFAPESPRRVSLEQAQRLFAAAPGPQRVGVFVNQTLVDIVEVAELCGLSLIQLHGEESPELCREVKERSGCAVIKALRVSGPESLASVAWFDTDYLLLDTYHPERRGGTGQTFDWGLAAQLPADLRAGRLILSGGLNPDNALAAAAAVAPFALDIASGVEAAPGVKDLDKIAKLFAILKGTVR